METLRLDVLPPANNTWIFQARLKKYETENALADNKFENMIHWAVRQHENEIRQGDRGIIWISGKDAGIYAITEILNDPELMSETEIEKEYWIDDTGERGEILRVRMKILLNLHNSPITRETIRNTLGLQALSILKMPQGTNFKVTHNEWNLIRNLIEKELLSTKNKSI